MLPNVKNQRTLKINLQFNKTKCYFLVEALKDKNDKYFDSKLAAEHLFTVSHQREDFIWIREVMREYAKIEKKFFDKWNKKMEKEENQEKNKTKLLNKTK